ncbi:MAG TPA: YjgN family protein [Burkholderiales bacterium]
MAHPSGAAPSAAGGVASLKFTGQAGEYFRIWIVNICLSIVTLGIYSAWAKVRRKRYFYGNTLLGDSAFEYLADPKAILKGRIVVFAGFAVYSIAGRINPLAGLAMGLVFLGVLPWLIVRASRFNAVNSAHRNVRFDFRAGYWEMVQLLILPFIMVPLTLGLLYPYYAYRKRRFFLEHSAFGTTPFTFDATYGSYLRVYLKAALMFVVFLVGSVATLGIGALPLYIWFAAYRDGAVARLTWRSTRLGGLRFLCGWTTGGLFKLYFLNSLGVIFSFGLLAPWAAVRTARYQLRRIALYPGAAIGAFLAAAQEQVGAIGDEAGDLLGFDFGL